MTAVSTADFNMSNGVAPVVGARNLAQVEWNVQALGRRLCVEQARRIDEVGLEAKKPVLVL